MRNSGDDAKVTYSRSVGTLDRRVTFRALLNLGMNFFMKGARRAPFIKKFIHEISNTTFRFGMEILESIEEIEGQYHFSIMHNAEISLID